MKLTLPALSLALLTLGLPAWAQEAPPATPAAKAKTAVENVTDKAAAATDKAASKAKDAAKKNKEKAAAPAKALPFYGEVTAADEAAKTVTLGENVYHLTDATIVHDGDKPAKFADVKVGRKIGGSYVTAEGKKELVKLNVGVKQEPTKPAAKEKEKEKAKPEAKEKAKPAAPAPAAPAEGTKK